MANEVQIVMTVIDKVSGHLAEIKGKVGGLTDGMNALGIAIPTTAIGALGAAVVATGKYVSDAIKDVSAYNRTIKLLSDNLSLTAEETSRVVQVGDDFGISIDQMRTSLQFAAKNGFAPSIENLANLADHLKTINDPTQRAAELTKIFGRSWSELTPLLNAGGDAIRDGSAAIADGMIATDAAIAKSEELRVAQDNLGDSLQAIKNTVGNASTPALTQLTNSSNQWLTAVTMVNDAYKKNLITLDEFIVLMAELTTGDKYAASIIEELSVSLGEQKDATDAINQADEKRYVITAKLTAAYELANPIIKSVKVATYELGQAIEANTQLLTGSSEAYYKAYEKTRLIAEATEKLTQRMEDYRTVLEGAIDQELEQFIDKQDELKQKVSQLNGKIADIEKKKYLTKSQKKELEELRGELALTNQAVDENAAAHEEATKRIMLSMLERKLAVGGMSSEEQSVLDALMVKWGLAGTMTQDTLDGMAKAISENTHEGILDVQGLIAAIGILLQYNGRVVNLSVVTSSSKLAPPGPPPGPGYTWDGTKWVKKKALGGPVSAGSPYIVGEVGPELFVPSTSGQIVPNNQMGGMGGVNITIYQASNPQAVAAAVVAKLNQSMRYGRSRAYAGAG
jgi:hypothetical protein